MNTLNNSCYLQDDEDKEVPQYVNMNAVLPLEHNTPAKNSSFFYSDTKYDDFDAFEALDGFDDIEPNDWPTAATIWGAKSVMGELPVPHRAAEEQHMEPSIPQRRLHEHSRGDPDTSPKSWPSNMPSTPRSTVEPLPTTYSHAPEASGTGNEPSGSNQNEASPSREHRLQVASSTHGPPIDNPGSNTSQVRLPSSSHLAATSMGLHHVRSRLATLEPTFSPQPSSQVPTYGLREKSCSPFVHQPMHGVEATQAPSVAHQQTSYPPQGYPQYPHHAPPGIFAAYRGEPLPQFYPQQHPQFFPHGYYPGHEIPPPFHGYNSQDMRGFYGQPAFIPYGTTLPSPYFPSHAMQQVQTYLPPGHYAPMPPRHWNDAWYQGAPNHTTPLAGPQPGYEFTTTAPSAPQQERREQNAENPCDRTRNVLRTPPRGSRIKGYSQVQPSPSEVAAKEPKVRSPYSAKKRRASGPQTIVQQTVPTDQQSTSQETASVDEEWPPSKKKARKGAQKAAVAHTPTKPGKKTSLKRVPSRLAIQPPSSSPSTGKTVPGRNSWTDEEEDACISIMREIISSAEPRSHDMKWVETSARMKSEYGFDRTSYAVKNQWNRVLREKSGIEERTGPHSEAKRTSLLATPSKRIVKHGKRRESTEEEGSSQDAEGGASEEGSED